MRFWTMLAAIALLPWAPAVADDPLGLQPIPRREVPPGVAGTDRFNIIGSGQLHGRAVASADGQRLGAVSQAVVDTRNGEIKGVIVDAGDAGLKVLPWAQVQVPLERAAGTPPFQVSPEQFRAAQRIAPGDLHDLTLDGQTPPLIAGERVGVAGSGSGLSAVEVFGPDGEKVGTVARVALDAERGRVAFLQLAPEESLKEIATAPIKIPFEAVEWTPDVGGFVLDRSGDNLAAVASGTVQGPQMGAEDMLNLYQNFGLQPYWQ